MITSDSEATHGVLIPADEAFLENLFRGQSWACLRGRFAELLSLGICSDRSFVDSEESLQFRVKKSVSCVKVGGISQSCARTGREKVEQRVQKNGQVSLLLWGVCVVSGQWVAVKHLTETTL